MPEIPTTAEYQAGDRNTKRVVGFLKRQNIK